MEQWFQFVKLYEFYILASFLLLIVIVFIISMIILARLSKLEKKYAKFMKGMDGKSLEEVVLRHIDNMENVSLKAKELEEEMDRLDNRLKLCIQKVGIVRFNAFDDVGSDLSFSIALLDHNDDGVVITSIYGRNDCTTYAKPIERGNSRYTLSAEELLAIERAIKKVR